MSGTTDHDLDIYDGADDGAEDGTAEGDAPEAVASSEPGGDADGDKRYSDLMSKWQKEQARANKLEKALKATKAPARGGDEVVEPDPRDAEMARWLDAAKESTRDRVYDGDARFKSYGLAKELVVGDSPEALKASAKHLSSLLDAVETKVRQSVLAEHGLSPEAGAGSVPDLPDFARMDEEAFNKLVKQTLGEL